MDNQYEYDAAARRRRKRIQEMKRRKRQQMLFRRYMKLGTAALLLLLCIGLISGKIKAGKQKLGSTEQLEEQMNIQEATEQGEVERLSQEESALSVNGSNVVSDNDPIASQPIKEKKVYQASESETTEGVEEEVNSTSVILIDLSTNQILAERNAKKIIVPASMTKILTVLVASEHMTGKSLEDSVTITREITDFAYQNDCSAVGFAENEIVTVQDLFYGTILPSGGDAAYALALYIAGSQEAFVELMNEKIEELGLSKTAHFTNCVGLYDENHYCSAYDMAMMMEAAVDDPLCQKVLSAHTYTTSQTTEHPDGITISNWFLRRIEDKDSGGEVLSAKTGYVLQSGNCAASYAIDHQKRGYVCVTANAHSAWRCIYDHVELYHKYLS